MHEVDLSHADQILKKLESLESSGIEVAKRFRK